MHVICNKKQLRYMPAEAPQRSLICLGKTTLANCSNRLQFRKRTWTSAQSEAAHPSPNCPRTHNNYLFPACEKLVTLLPNLFNPSDIKESLLGSQDT
jgi:hypothetical protein